MILHKAVLEGNLKVAQCFEPVKSRVPSMWFLKNMYDYATVIMGGLCIEWEIPDLVRLWNSHFKIQGWEDLSFFIKLQAKMLHFLWGKSSSSYWNSKSWKVLKQILLQNVTKILKGIRVWALFYPFKILVNLNLLYCKAACWNLLGQMYSILHRYKQDSANQNKLKFQGGWISLIFKDSLNV